MNKILSALALFAILCQTIVFASVLEDATSICGRHNAEVCLVEGNSMTPFFNNGDLVVVKQMNADSLKVGMIVVYENKFGELVSHRIIRKTESGYVVRGYNNNADDSSLVTDTNLKGVVYAIFHNRKTKDNDLRLPSLKKVLAATPR